VSRNHQPNTQKSEDENLLLIAVALPFQGIEEIPDNTSNLHLHKHDPVEVRKILSGKWKNKRKNS